MLDQRTVDQWLGEFLARLKNIFGDRLVFVGHHGSWVGLTGKSSLLD